MELSRVHALFCSLSVKNKAGKLPIPVNNLLSIACGVLALSVMCASADMDRPEFQSRDLLPKPPAIDTKPHITIDIGRGGEIKVNGRAHEKAKALKRIEALGKEKPDGVVVVSAMDEAKHDLFVAVINALARAGVKNVTMTGFRDGDKDCS